MVNLLEFTWAFKTNLEAKLLAPKDAVILLLKDGPVTRKDLIATISAWRPFAIDPYAKPQFIQAGVQYPATYGYLFNASYHNVAQSVKGDTYTNWRHKSDTFDKAYWYRIKRGTYALTLSGIKRMHQLGF